jgi:hypothetical protein
MVPAVNVKGLPVDTQPDQVLAAAGIGASLTLAGV